MALENGDDGVCTAIVYQSQGINFCVWSILRQIRILYTPFGTWWWRKTLNNAYNRTKLNVGVWLMIQQNKIERRSMAMKGSHNFHFICTRRWHFFLLRTTNSIYACMQNQSVLIFLIIIICNAHITIHNFIVCHSLLSSLISMM